MDWSIQPCVTDDAQRSFPRLQFDRELVESLSKFNSTSRQTVVIAQAMRNLISMTMATVGEKLKALAVKAEAAALAAETLAPGS